MGTIIAEIGIVGDVLGEPEVAFYCD